MMKTIRSIALFFVLFLLSCGDQSNPQPQCDVEGISLTHKSRTIKGSAETQGTEYHIAISIDGKAVDAIADTGSSNLIVNNDSGFSPSGSSIEKPFQISYGDGANLNTVHLTPYNGVVALNCASSSVSYTYGDVSSTDPADYQAETLLGLAYPSIQTGPQVGTFLDLLVKNNPGMHNEISMLLCGADNKNSKIKFGGLGAAVPPKKAFEYVPLVEQSYYVINAGEVTIGGVSMGNLSTDRTRRTIVDSGTTLNLVPQSIYNAIALKLGFTGSYGVELSCPSTAVLAQLPPVMIALDNLVTLTIKPETYYKQIGNGACFFGFMPTNGNLNILGQVTMENYHVHFIREQTPELPAPADSFTHGAIGFSENDDCKN